jgi:hypothetical protein
MAHSHNLVWQEARALNNLGAMVQRDDPGETLQISRQAEELSRRTGNLGTMNYFRGGQVDWLFELGRWDEARQIIEDLEDLPIDDPNLIDLQTSRIKLLAAAGQGAAAAEAIAALRNVIAGTNFEPLKANLRMTQAHAEALAGHFDAAARHAAEGMGIEGGEAGTQVCAEWVARIALWTGDVEPAREANEWFAKWGTKGRLDVAAAAEVRGIVAALENRPADAAAAFRQAIVGTRSLGLRWELGLYLTDLATALPPSMPGVADAADEARQIWTELGSPPMLARLETGLAHWRENNAPARKGAAEVESPASA